MEEIGKKIEKSLQNWLKNNPQGIIICHSWELVLMGIFQALCHIQRILKKFNKMFNSDKNLVAGYNAGGKNQYPQRVTTTMLMLRKINVAIVYAVGENKLSAFAKIKNKRRFSGNYHQEF